MNPFFTLHPTFKHFLDLFELTMFPRWAWNTLFIATVSTGISLFCGLLAGYALARLQFRWAPPLGTMIFITYLVPPTLLFIPLGDVVKTFGLGDTPWAVILTYPTFLIPFCTWLLMGYFKTIPREIEECARIDGASRIQAMVRISFPLAVPGILSAGIFAFTLSWNEFLYALVFLSSPQQKTIPIGVFTELVRGDVFYWGPLMAGALLVVQINHDAKLAGDFELNLVDEAYATLLGTHQSAQVPADLLPLVFVSDTKMARFGEGGRRRIFRWLEPTMQLHPDIHLSPAAIFISDENFKDRERLRSALTRALSFLFDRPSREALASMARPLPDK